MRTTPLTAKLEDLAHTLTPAQDVDSKDFAATRRGLLLAPLLAALPAALIADPAHAIDPNETWLSNGLTAQIGPPRSPVRACFDPSLGNPPTADYHCGARHAPDRL